MHITPRIRYILVVRTYTILQRRKRERSTAVTYSDDWEGATFTHYISFAFDTDPVNRFVTCSVLLCVSSTPDVIVIINVGTR
jgi:hypothetical protein